MRGDGSQTQPSPFVTMSKIYCQRQTVREMTAMIIFGPFTSINTPTNKFNRLIIYHARRIFKYVLFKYSQRFSLPKSQQLYTFQYEIQIVQIKVQIWFLQFISLRYPWVGVFRIIKLNFIVQQMGQHQSKRRKRQHTKRHQWTLQENKRYLLYLQHHQHLFKDFKTKKIAKVFVNLAQQVQSRTTNQVKSHHQKMVGKYGSIDNIIVYLSEEQEVFGKEGSTELETNKSQEHQSPRPTLMLEGSYHHDNHAGHIFLDEESSHNQHQSGFLAPKPQYHDNLYDRNCQYESEDYERKASEFFNEMIN